MKFTYDIEGGEYVNAGAASSQFKKILKQLGIAPETIRKVAICMYEAEINMVIHANGGKIEAQLDASRIQILCKDQGPGIADIELAMQEGYSTASDEARNMGFGAGMGLPNIKRYSDVMNISSQLGIGTTVDIHIQINE